MWGYMCFIVPAIFVCVCVFLILHFGNICLGCISELPPYELFLVLPSYQVALRGWLHWSTFTIELSCSNDLWGKAEGLWEQHLLVEAKLSTLVCTAGESRASELHSRQWVGQHWLRSCWNITFASSFNRTSQLVMSSPVGTPESGLWKAFWWGIVWCLDLPPW